MAPMVKPISSDAAGIFTGMMLVLYAAGNGHSCAVLAGFDWFEYHG